MKNFAHFILVVGFVLMCAAAPVHATDLTLFGGMQAPGKLTFQSATNTLTTIDPPKFGTYGLRFSAGRIIGSEETIEYSPRFLSSQSHALFYNSNLIMQLPLPFVRPYGTVGLGAAYVGGGTDAAIKGTKLALNYGGGVKVKLFGPLGVQADARGYRMWGFQGHSLNMVEVTVGAVLSF